MLGMDSNPFVYFLFCSFTYCIYIYCYKIKISVKTQISFNIYILYYTVLPGTLQYSSYSTRVC